MLRDRQFLFGVRAPGVLPNDRGPFVERLRPGTIERAHSVRNILAQPIRQPNTACQRKQTAPLARVRPSAALRNLSRGSDRSPADPSEEHWDFDPPEKELTPLPVLRGGSGHRKRWFKNPIDATIALTVEGALLARNDCPCSVGSGTQLLLIFGRQQGFVHETPSLYNCHCADVFNCAASENKITREFLDGLEFSDSFPTGIILVDNGSTDGTEEILLANGRDGIRLIFGFSRETARGNRTR